MYQLNQQILIIASSHVQGEQIKILVRNKNEAC